MAASRICGAPDPRRARHRIWHASLSTQAEATAKLPHNISTEELTKYLVQGFGDHGEGEYLDRHSVGILPESDQGDKAARAKNEEHVWRTS